MVLQERFAWEICLLHFLICDPVQFLGLAEGYFAATKHENIVIDLATSEIVKSCHIVLPKVKDRPFKVDHVEDEVVKLYIAMFYGVE